jgi:hypothetical protein
LTKEELVSITSGSEVISLTTSITRPKFLARVGSPMPEKVMTSGLVFDNALTRSILIFSIDTKFALVEVLFLV